MNRCDYCRYKNSRDGEDDYEIVVDTIRPEWLRREIAEAVINGNSIKIQISNGNVFDREYYVKLVDRSKQ